MVFRCCRPDAIAGCLTKATRWVGDTGEYGCDRRHGDQQALFRNANDQGSGAGVRSEARELRPQARHGEVHEGADFRNRKPALRRDDMDRQRGVLV